MNLTLIRKVISTIRTRQGHLWSALREYFLFARAGFWRRFIRLKGVELGDNVRLQSNRSVMAESPGARIFVADDCVIYENASLSAYGAGHVEIGEGSILGDVSIVSRYGIRIGKRFLSSWNVFIQDFDPHPIAPSLRALQVQDMSQQKRPWASRSGRRPKPKALDPSIWAFPGEPILIGDDVWIGANCTILKGARIGSGCVVATGSVVAAGEYPDRSIIGGVPAKLIKRIEE